MNVVSISVHNAIRSSLPLISDMKIRGLDTASSKSKWREKHHKGFHQMDLSKGYRLLLKETKIWGKRGPAVCAESVGKTERIAATSTISPSRKI